MAVWTIKLNDKIVKQFPINEGDRVVIGRGTSADVIVDNTAISREHTALVLKNGVYFVEDMGSLNGTLVNGRRIDALTQLFENDVVELGKFSLLPTGASENGQAQSSSSYVDHGDETVFVSQKKKTAPSPKSKEKERPKSLF